MQSIRSGLVVRLLLACAVLFSVPHVVAAQPPAAQSSPAAVRQYRAAVALQNREIYDLAADEWSKFLQSHSGDPLAPKARHYLGVCKLQLGEYADAQAAFEQVLADEQFPMRENAHYYLGLAQYNRGREGQPEQYEQAAETLGEYAADYREGQFTAQAIFYRAESLYARGSRDQAIKGYEEFLDRYPQHALRPDALYALGVAQEEAGQTGQAGAAYDAFLKDYLRHRLAAEVVLRRGETLLVQGHPEQAAKWFATAAGVKGFEKADHATMRLAAARYEQKQYDEAAKTYASVIERFPKSNQHAAARLAAGNCYFLAGNYEAARTWLNQVLQAGGESAAEAAHWIARSYLKQGQPEEALGVVERALPAAKGVHLVSLKLDHADALYELPNRRAEAAERYARIANESQDSPQAPQALYMASFAWLGLEDYKTAKELAERFLGQHAGHVLEPDVQYVLAECRLQLEQYPQAAELFAELAEEHPGRPEADAWQVRRGLAVYLAGQHDQALQLLKPLVERLDDGDAKAEALYIIGSAQLEQGQAEQALASLEASLGMHAKSAQADEVLLALSRAQRETGQVDQAESTVRRVIDEFPQSKLLDRAYYRLGEYAYAAGDYSQAASAYRKVLESWPNSALAPHARFGLGWAELAQNRSDEADALLTELIDDHPDHPLAGKARYGRAVARERLGRHDDAIDDLQAFLKTQPAETERLDAEYVLGLCQVGTGDYRAAAETFADILENSPNYSAADKVLYELAWAYKEAGDAEQAAEAFARLSTSYPESKLAAEAGFHQAEREYEQQNYQAAAERYRAVMERADQRELLERAAHKLGWALYQQEDYEAAREAFERQLAAGSPGELAADGLFMRAECLFKQAKYEPALEAYREALDAKPSRKEFQALALLHAGQSAAQLKRWEESGQLLEKAGGHGDSAYLPEIWYELGWVRQNEGRLDDALVLYERAAEAPREVGARARFMMGEIYFAKKDHKEAVRQFFKAAYGYDAPKWQADATFEAARCFEVLENLEQAKKSYEELLEKFPTSDKATAARQRLEQLRG